MNRALYAAGPLGLAFLVIGVGWWVLAPRVLPIAYVLMMVAGVTLCAASLWSSRNRLFDRSSGKRVAYGAGFFFSAVVSLLILLLVNFIAARYNERWDLTRYKAHSLHPATLRVLEGIEEDTEVVAFIPERERNRTRAVHQLYSLFKFHQPLIDVTVADANKYPALVAEFGVGGNGRTVVRSGDRMSFFPEFGEEKLAKALLEVQSSQSKVVYWVIGHGERPMRTAGGEGYLRLRGDLVKSYHEIRPLSLAPGDQVPDDASLVVMMDPKDGVPELELEAYHEYLSSGGRMMVFADLHFGAASKAFPVSGLLERWGVKVLDGAVIDARKLKREQYDDPLLLMTGSFDHRHASVEGLGGRHVLLAGSRPLTPLDIVMEDQQIFQVTLVRSSPGTYVERDLSVASKFTAVNQTAHERWKNNQPIVALAAFRTWVSAIGSDELGRESRLVLVGDADFLKDDYYDTLANGELAQNLFRWLSGTEVLIQRAGENLTAKQAMSIESDQRRLILMVVVVLPMAVFLLGWVVWFMRRTK